MKTTHNPLKYADDKNFADRLVNGDQQAWADFVDHYTDWVFYKANQWSARETQFSREKKRVWTNPKSGKKHRYSEAAADAYHWIFQQLRNKLAAYTGKSKLSTFVWSVLNSQYLFIDYLRTRPAAEPRVIQKSSKAERQVFVLLRENIPIDQIADALDRSYDEILGIRERILTKLRQAGQTDALQGFAEIELNETLANVLRQGQNATDELRAILRQVIARYTEALSLLAESEKQLLTLFFNENLQADEILAAFQAVGKELPNGKPSTEATRRDIYKILEKSKNRLLRHWRKLCKNMPNVVIDLNTINVFLDQFGVIKIWLIMKKFTKVTHIDDETLGAFLEADLAADENEKIERHLRDCTTCFQRMALLQKSLRERESLDFTTTPSDLVEKAKQQTPTPEMLIEQAKKLPSGKVSGLWHRFAKVGATIRDWLAPLPAWGYGLAGMAVLAVLIFLLLPSAPIQNFSIDDKLTISELGPFGFTDQREQIDYSGMSVTLSADGERIVFSWPEIPDAEFYEITVIAENARRKITPPGGILKTQFAISKQEIEVGMEYIWELSGRLKDRRAFQARAVFVRKE